MDNTQPDTQQAIDAQDGERPRNEKVNFEGIPSEPPTTSDAQFPTISQTATPRFDHSDARGWQLAILAFQAIGVVYGDIGTSPLYVLNGIFASDGPAPSEEDVIGIISTIIWVFSLVVVVKYAVIVLRFGNGFGEGGPFALLLSLYPRGPSGVLDVDHGADTNSSSLKTLQMTNGQLTMRTESINAWRAKYQEQGEGEAEAVRPSGRKYRFGRTPTMNAYKTKKVLNRPFIRIALSGWALLGSAMTLADGILTPAVSVVSAAEGIAVVQPDQTDNTRPIAIAILVVLVAAQSFGIHRLSVPYAPLVSLWLLFLFITGAYNCHLHPGIWRAWDPSRAVLYFVRTGNYKALSGVILAVTGCEALFANLGQLGAPAIQLPLVFFVYPSLMLAYLGQGAALVANGPAVISNIFYLTIPGGSGNGIYWLGFVLGLLATIIASQAMLTASYSIVSQLVHMHCFPNVKLIFPSKDAGQVYIPSVNYLIGAAIVAVVGGFGSSSNLTQAYGFAVASVMLITTTEICVVMVAVKQWPIIIAVVFLLFFGFIDGLLWGSTALKIPHGAWFTLGVGIAIALFLYFWTWMTAKVDKFDLRGRSMLNEVIAKEAGASQSADDVLIAQPLTLRALDGLTKSMPRSCSVAVFWKPAGGVGVPHSFARFLTRYPSCPSLVVFLSLIQQPVDHVPMEQALSLTRSRTLPGFFSATLSQGHKEVLNLAELDGLLTRKLIELEQMAAPLQETPDKKSNDYIVSACSTVTHIWPSYYVVSRNLQAKDAGFPRRFAVATRNYCRAWLIEVLYGRLKGVFAEEDGPFDAREEVIRMTVTCAI